MVLYHIKIIILEVKMINAIRIIKFDAGHRVLNHESKCRTLHGHEYKAEVYVSAKKLDDLGRVIDFSIVKQIIGKWIDENWDHNMIIFKEDPNLILLQQCDGMKKPWVADFNPTAENLATFLINKSNELLNKHDVVVTKIKLWETSNCYVEVTCEY